MPGKLNKLWNLTCNMGLRYVGYRARYVLMQKSGLLKRKFPAAPPFKQYITLNQWKEQKTNFFFRDKESLNIPKVKSTALQERWQQMRNGKLLMFNGVLFDLGRQYDWITNPDSGHRYNAHTHWADINEYSQKAGDIKYVWEKSRFSYLYDIIRYDYHFEEDCSAQVFNDILSWIKNNPVNCGPNYQSSQEIALRVLNWIFALHYYRNSPALTNEVFDKMQYAIYWQLHHIYNNIQFSRIAVRNNHAITETLTLYLAGLLFPSLPGAAQWKKRGKAWFEKEIAYQIYEDGTYLQFSMNYHRIVVQLLTWGITLAEKNNEKFAPVVYERARKSVEFLRTCMVAQNGWLPNYGANDGALFFKLNDAHYRDYRPQLQALARALNMNIGLQNADEDVNWYGLPAIGKNEWQPADGIHSFNTGGYYIIREPDTLTFIRCGKHKDRPSQADNLHLDIWYKGENILTDAGSYKYNTGDATMRYFSGTASHNTVMLDNKDQMLKGGRFIWYYWSQARAAVLQDEASSYIFKGAVSVFRHVRKGIVHSRTVIKQKGVPAWEIKDEVIKLPKSARLKQLWHVPEKTQARILITAKDKNGNALTLHQQEGWSSSVYGQKEKTKEYYFSTEHNSIDTTIRIAATS